MAYDKWEKGGCTERGCGCVTECVLKELRPIIKKREDVAKAQGRRDEHAEHCPTCIGRRTAHNYPGEQPPHPCEVRLKMERELEELSKA